MVALAIVAAPAAWAQQGGPAAPAIVAHLANVEGNVLVSNASGLAAGGNGLALTKGTRVITPANGKAVIQFDDDCKVSLQPNQRLVIDPSKPCNQRMLLVQSTLPQPPITPIPPPTTNLASAALSGSLQDSAGLLAGGLMGATAIVRWRRDETVSPN